MTGYNLRLTWIRPTAHRTNVRGTSATSSDSRCFPESGPKQTAFTVGAPNTNESLGHAQLGLRLVHILLRLRGITGVFRCAPTRRRRFLTLLAGLL